MPTCPPPRTRLRFHNVRTHSWAAALSGVRGATPHSPTCGYAFRMSFTAPFPQVLIAMKEKLAESLRESWALNELDRSSHRPAWSD
jgi:hypothetical protein